jgi:hypothetical protein
MTKLRKPPGPKPATEPQRSQGQVPKPLAKELSKELPKDIAILHGPTEDGEGARMLRFREGAVYAGEVRPVREGQSVEHHELVRLKPLEPESPICEVEILHAPEARRQPQRKGTGPARVATDGYRRNWGAIFGRGRTEPHSLN